MARRHDVEVTDEQWERIKPHLPKPQPNRKGGRPRADVLNNDSDADGDPLLSLLVSPPEHGALSLLSDGSFIYEPDPGFAGTDSFTYKASDGVTDSEATVTIIVGNSPPVAHDDFYSVEAGEALSRAT